MCAKKSGQNSGTFIVKLPKQIKNTEKSLFHYTESDTHCMVGDMSRLLISQPNIIVILKLFKWLGQKEELSVGLRIKSGQAKRVRSIHPIRQYCNDITLLDSYFSASFFIFIKIFTIDLNCVLYIARQPIVVHHQ